MYTIYISYVCVYLQKTFWNNTVDAGSNDCWFKNRISHLKERGKDKLHTASQCKVEQIGFP